MESKPKIRIRHRLPILWMILFLVLAIILPSRIWMTFLVGLGCAYLLSYFWARQLANGLKGNRRLRFGWVAVGDRLSEEFVIQNHSPLPALWVEVVDHSNIPGYEVAVVRAVSEQGVERWRQSAICLRRGQYQLGPWEIKTADPFGIFQVSVPYPHAENIVIHPPIHTQIPIPLPAGTSSGRVRARELSWQATINAATVRQHQISDPLSWIHWPTSARREDLYTRQFDLDAAGDIWLLLDMQAAAQVGGGMDGSEEQAVLLAAALAAQGLNQNRPVGLAAYSVNPHLIQPGRGQGQQWRLLRALALVRADGESNLSSALKDIGQFIKRGSALVIITSSGGVEWLPDVLSLARRGVRPQVILFDRSTFVEGPDDGVGLSMGIHNSVQHMGIESRLVRRGEIGQPSSTSERHGFWEFKVSGTGKVIAVKSPFDQD